MLSYLWVVYLFLLLFIVGSAVGSFLNVCIARLPHGLSLLHPPSRCGICLRRIRLRDNLPLLSYWILRGRCRACGAPFSLRYFGVELLTGLAFVGQYYLEQGMDIHHFGSFKGDGLWYLTAGRIPPSSFTLFPFHAVMVCFLIVSVACLLETGTIPRSVVATGIVAGLIGATLLPWPSPLSTAQAVQTPDFERAAGFTPAGINPAARQPAFLPSAVVESWWGQPRTGPMPAEAPWWSAEVSPRSGFISWPVWGPLPAWLPSRSMPLGLTTGLAGVFAGALLLGVGRLLFNAGLGANALPLGDVGLLMVAGAFLGWQPVAAAFLIALGPALVHTFIRWRRGQRRTTFALWLGIGLLPAWLAWSWIGPYLQPIFFNGPRLVLFIGSCWAVLLAAGFGLRTRISHR